MSIVVKKPSSTESIVDVNVSRSRGMTKPSGTNAMRPNAFRPSGGFSVNPALCTPVVARMRSASS